MPTSVFTHTELTFRSSKATAKIKIILHYCYRSRLLPLFPAFRVWNLSDKIVIKKIGN